MKKLNVLKFFAFALLGGAILFTACKKEDTGAPVITLTGGDQTVAFDLSKTFTDPGFTASDDEDGDITSKVVVSGSVNLKSAGEYTLKYNVTDEAGNAATEQTRKITVDAGIYVASATGVVYDATGWYNNSTSTDAYMDTLFVDGVNKFRFTRIANWKSAAFVVSVSGTTITATDQTMTTGHPATSKVYKLISAQLLTSSSSGNIFELKGSVTEGSTVDEFFYTFKKH